jgi:hypothetical protein
MKLRAIALPAIAILSLSILPVQTAKADSALSYEGTVGASGIGMTLYVNNGLPDLLGSGRISGKYFYTKFLKDIKLDGETDGNVASHYLNTTQVARRLPQLRARYRRKIRAAHSAQKSSRVRFSPAPGAAWTAQNHFRFH